jgi:hypothetical protein
MVLAYLLSDHLRPLYAIKNLLRLREKLVEFIRRSGNVDDHRIDVGVDDDEPVFSVDIRNDAAVAMWIERYARRPAVAPRVIVRYGSVGHVYPQSGYASHAHRSHFRSPQVWVPLEPGYPLLRAL